MHTHYLMLRLSSVPILGFLCELEGFIYIIINTYILFNEAIQDSESELDSYKFCAEMPCI